MPLEYWLIIHLKKIFMGKEKKLINVLTTFFISHKNSVKTFLKLIVNQYSKDTREYDSSFNMFYFICSGSRLKNVKNFNLLNTWNVHKLFISLSIKINSYFYKIYYWNPIFNTQNSTLSRVSDHPKHDNYSDIDGLDFSLELKVLKVLQIS